MPTLRLHPKELKELALPLACACCDRPPVRFLNRTFTIKEKYPVFGRTVPAQRREVDRSLCVVHEFYWQNRARTRNRVLWFILLGAGWAWLPWLVVCGRCGRHLRASYRHKHFAQYGCVWHLVEAREQTCYGMAAAPLDTLVSQQVLRALEPVALTLSLQARADVQRERERLALQERQRLERAL